eukprot:NODE_13339_length_1171_cov_5.636973.p1 GENE.NODE_13339_length_1171_cov_5.636973~~NODE_13339_length_1171_cov_5.636973.p1  ORF type:complete len:253 (+),score=95.84 NODE_13339_length_1171_cov_5.636973:142-900(+)
MGYGVPDTGVDFDFITPKDAHALMRSDGAIFVDARDFPDFEKSRLQTSFHLAANDITFRIASIDKDLVPKLTQIARSSRLIICVSDVGITGMENRGHVSRCRHIAQFLVEMGMERDSIRRLEGGLNTWKTEGLDGILGDRRLFYAGRLMNVVHGSEPPPPLPEMLPTAFRILRGEVYRRREDSEKIIKVSRDVGSTVRTTGETWRGPSGGLWAKLDTSSGEKPGWAYVEGPGFGASSCKTHFEFMTSGSNIL